MSIQDILLPTAGSVAPSDLLTIESMVHVSKGNLSDDIQSGSIIKILMENGFQEKMSAGYAQGHRYTILHAAPSSDFTLVDSWSESSVDDKGVPITIPRKAYQFFKIQEATSMLPIIRPEEIGSPTESIQVTAEPVVLPIIEQVVAPEESVSVPVVEQVIIPTQEEVPVEEIVPKEEEVMGVEEVPVSPVPPLSSYDLLKQRFAQANTSSNEQIPIVSKKITTGKDAFIEMAFGSPLEGLTLDTWNHMKNIPARSFVYPAQYGWGTDSEGKQINRTTDDYPPLAQKFRERFVSIVDSLKRKDVSVETITVEEALAQAEKFGLV